MTIEKRTNLFNEIQSLKKKYLKLVINIIEEAEFTGKIKETGVKIRNRDVIIDILENEFEEKMPEYLILAEKKIGEIEKELLHDINNPNLIKSYYASSIYNNLFNK